MADIELRFHKDMLVLSAPVLPALEHLGLDAAHDTEFTLLLEPDTFEDAYRLEAAAGAQCLVASTATLTPARLAHVGMTTRASEIARVALNALRPFVPQHVLVEIAPCGLPLDGSSRTSLNENLNQYARVGQVFEDAAFDAFFLNGFESCDALKCALMGLSRVSDKPIFASVDVRGDGMLANGRETMDDAVYVMNDLGASVAGFATAEDQDEAAGLAARMAAQTNLPLLVQLHIAPREVREKAIDSEVPYSSPDSMMMAAIALREAGVQFLRATGDATPAYTGALVAATMGLDVCVPEEAPEG